MNHAQDRSSYGRTRARFDSSQAASKYEARGLDVHRYRESQCVRAALSGLAPASRVLDLPCGAGYLTRTIVDAGFLATAADVSGHMIERAKAAWEAACFERPERHGKAQFMVQDVMHTSFPDGYFDAVVCNRLLHHFYEPAMRCAALAELRRISAGPVVVFYFDRFALDSIRLAALRFALGKFRRDRIPISTKTFVAEAKSVGLELDKVLWKRWGISPQAYALFRPINTSPASVSSIPYAAAQFDPAVNVHIAHELHSKARASAVRR